MHPNTAFLESFSQGTTQRRLYPHFQTKKHDPEPSVLLVESGYQS